MVRKLAMIGISYNNDGLEPEVVKGIASLTPEMVPKQFYDDYEKVAPEPGQWAGVVGKIREDKDNGGGMEGIFSARSPRGQRSRAGDGRRPGHRAGGACRPDVSDGVSEQAMSIRLSVLGHVALGT
jgi:hypothetical protein